MAEHNELGIRGENDAAVYLQKKGYEILEKNYRVGKAELDIIAKEGDELVFVEVKSRSYETIISAEDAINTKKKGLLLEAANHYLESNNLDNYARFDIISIIYNPENTEIRHIKDAFNALL